MKSGQGVFITIEGTEGSGKSTQSKLLAERLTAAGYEVAIFDFPRYDEPSSYFLKEYLNGHYGDPEEVGPYTGSLFFALDRYQAASQIREALEEGKIVLANRFTASSMVHHGTNFHHAEERRGYFMWVENLEFVMLRIPRPNMNIVLSMPPEITRNLLINQSPYNHQANKPTTLDPDLSYLQRSKDVYDDICKLFPKDFTQIECVREGKLLSITAINSLVWDKLLTWLPEKPSRQRSGALKPTMTSRDSSEVKSDDDDFWRGSVASMDEGVYIFTEKLSASTIATAIARLRSDDMRTILTDVLAQTTNNDNRLSRNISAHQKDDITKQLINQYFVIEGASQLLTKKLERGRLATYVEQSPQHGYFDRKDVSGSYKYYTPPHFDEATRDTYRKSMDEIFRLYSAMILKLAQYLRQQSQVPQTEQNAAWQEAIRTQACYVLQQVLPAATKSTVGIYASVQALENLVTRLQSDELPEAVLAGQKLLDHARQVIPTYLEMTDKPSHGGATIAYKANTFFDVKGLAEEYLPNNHSLESEAIQLSSVWPRNELALVPDMIYEHSNLSLKEIEGIVGKWSYDKKCSIFQAYIGERLNRRHQPGRTLEKAHYSWDLLCDYRVFIDLQRHRMVDDLGWQHLSPRYGYETPQLVEDAGIEEAFETCFDISLKLYSTLQKAGYPIEAQYAVLLGHKMRWKVTHNAREAFHIFELSASPQTTPKTRELLLEMHSKLAEVHPLLARAMKFINQAENPEMDRLAAEKYTQFRLQQLSKTGK